MRERRLLPVDDLIAFAAFRYALGRMTYMAVHVAEYLTANKAALSAGTRDLIAKEIAAYDAIGRLGMEMDAKVWRQTREAMIAP